VMRVNLYADVIGRYLPKLDDPRQTYETGPDGRAYLVTRTRNGGRMKLVESIRGEIPERRRRRRKVHV